MAFRRRRRPRSTRGGNSKRFFLILLLLIVAVAGGGGFILFFEGDKPVINVIGTGEYLGKDATIDYKVTDIGSGIQTVTVWGVQGDLTKTLDIQTFPRTAYQSPVGPLKIEQTVNFDVVKRGFKDGPMTITIEATDFSLRGWFMGNKVTFTKQLTVDTVPPRIQILHSEKYIAPGGTGIAIYKVSDKESSHGVNVNGKYNPGFPIGDGRDDTFISYFGLAYDAEQIDKLAIVAMDPAGNETIVPFSTTFKKPKQRKDTINVSDSFLKKKIPEFQQYYPEMKGAFIEKYLYANSTIRKKNNEKISSLCQTPSPERFWRGSFYRMPGSSRAGYADYRTYMYKGKPVDYQVHLGMDIASTRRAEVRGANKGKVVFADYLGIYGNMVLVDHGQGVFSLYSHLSQINAAPGDEVDQQTVLGLTGATGMAGGDHLHFSMLINGLFVTPIEWWDQHWIEVTIDEPITDSKF